MCRACTISRFHGVNLVYTHHPSDQTCGLASHHLLALPIAAITLVKEAAVGLTSAFIRSKCASASQREAALSRAIRCTKRNPWFIPEQSSIGLSPMRASRASIQDGIMHLCISSHCLLAFKKPCVHICSHMFACYLCLSRALPA